MVPPAGGTADRIATPGTVRSTDFMRPTPTTLPN
jgi:hypothetical protein